MPEFFDGQGHAIKGWVGKPQAGQEAFIGALFTRLNGDSADSVTVKNLTIDGFYSKLIDKSYSDQGVIADQIIKGANIQNVTIKNAVLETNIVYTGSDKRWQNFASGMIAGSYYSDSSKTGQGTEFWLNLNCVSIDSSCKFVDNGTTVANSASADGAVGGLIGRYWAATGITSGIAIKSSSFNFVNASSSFSPLQMDGEGAAYANVGNVKVKIDDKTPATYDTSATGANRAAAIKNAIINSGYYGTASASKQHKSTAFNEVPAQCNKTGTSAGTKCSICDKILAGGVTLQTVAHSYVGGVCKWCSTPDPSVTTPATGTTTVPTPGTTTVIPDAGTTTVPTPGTTPGTTPDVETTNTNAVDGTTAIPDEDGATKVPDAGTTTPNGETTFEPTDDHVGDDITFDEPASGGCGGVSGIGTIAAVAVSVISVFGLALIIKKH